MQLESVSVRIKNSDFAKARIASDTIERSDLAVIVAQEREEAIKALQKIEETRSILNQLIGPSGSLSGGDRRKFTPSIHDISIKTIENGQ